MTLQEEMDSKLSWTQEEINDLKRKHRRTHFTHFQGAGKKLKGKSPNKWVRVGVGRYKLVKK